jgi:hypothetical protein
MDLITDTTIDVQQYVQTRQLQVPAILSDDAAKERGHCPQAILEEKPNAMHGLCAFN